jgi:hypothetical protein
VAARAVEEAEAAVEEAEAFGKEAVEEAEAFGEAAVEEAEAFGKEAVEEAEAFGEAAVEEAEAFGKEAFGEEAVGEAVEEAVEAVGPIARRATSRFARTISSSDHKSISDCSNASTLSSAAFSARCAFSRSLTRTSACLSLLWPISGKNSAYLSFVAALWSGGIVDAEHFVASPRGRLFAISLAREVLQKPV